ncbi:MAG: AgmX/PglI C-terminal domain-containing protein [bacterium]
MNNNYKLLFLIIFIVLWITSCGPKQTEIVWESALVGTRLPDSIRYYFDLQKDTIQKLYKNRLYVVPDLQGNFILKFMIRSDGQVENIFLDSCQLNDPVLESQIRLAVSNWTFPRSPEDSIEVLVPIYLLQEE